MKKILSLLLAFALGAVMLTGCTANSGFNTVKSNKTLNIAVLGSEEHIKNRKDFFTGVDLAISELKNDGITVNYKIFDDKGSFDTGVSNAKKVVDDKMYSMAFTVQGYEIVDTVAKIFDDAKKPLIIVNGCYDETMKKGYNCVFNLTLSAEDQGKNLGEYVAKEGNRLIAIAHGGSKYNIDFAEGFADAINGSTNNNKIIDSVGNLNKAVDFEAAYNRWKALGVTDVIISYENMDWAMELVKLIRTANANDERFIPIYTDSYFNNLSYMPTYGEYIQNIVMPSSYPIDSDERLNAFYKEYETKVMQATGVDITSISAQGYDITKMIVEKLKGNVNTVDEFVNAMKSPEGYEGVTGIKFTTAGLLNKNAKDSSKLWYIDGDVVRRMTK